MLIKYAHLYAPVALARLRQRDTPEKEERSLMSLPRGATLPKEPAATPVYEHSANYPARKLSALEVAQHLRAEALKRGKKWPLV